MVSAEDAPGERPSVVRVSRSSVVRPGSPVAVRAGCSSVVRVSRSSVVRPGSPVVGRALSVGGPDSLSSGGPDGWFGGDPARLDGGGLAGSTGGEPAVRGGSAGAIAGSNGCGPDVTGVSLANELSGRRQGGHGCRVAARGGQQVVGVLARRGRQVVGVAARVDAVGGRRRDARARVDHARPRTCGVTRCHFVDGYVVGDRLLSGDRCSTLARTRIGWISGLWGLPSGTVIPIFESTSAAIRWMPSGRLPVAAAIPVVVTTS